MIDSFINNGIRKPKAVRGKAATVPKVNAAMYAAIQERVHSFLALINWWQKLYCVLVLYSLETLSSGITSVETQSSGVTSVEEDECLILAAQEDAEQTERNKLLVKVLQENTVSQLVRKAKVSWTPSGSTFEGLLLQMSN
ncbi:Hypothetical predicted protein [Scomber scombrus]|uniref:Uncharacterized protein n=1 Tax=Scomber scombrus TaxID=13677 RepID=A0AAV1NQL6_SCOSC